MATTVTTSGITFPDATTQTTAAVAGATISAAATSAYTASQAAADGWTGFQSSVPDVYDGYAVALAINALGATTDILCRIEFSISTTNITRPPDGLITGTRATAFAARRVYRTIS